MIAHPLIRIFALLALALLPFWAVRTALLIHYDQVFSALSVGDIALAYLYGLRFDLSALIKLIGLPLLLLALPYGWARARWWQGLWHWWVFVAIVLTSLVLIADFIYFGFVNRHVGAELALIADDTRLMLDIAVSDHGLALVMFVLAIFAAAWAWRRSFATPVRPSRNPNRRSLALLGLLLLFVLVARGGVQYKPVGVADAFAFGSPAAGYLAMNGAFAAQYSLSRGAPKQQQYMPPEQARALVRQQVGMPGDQFVSNDYPVMRDSKASFHPDRPPNVVMVVFESWDAANTDVMRKLSGKESMGATPVFDQLASQGRLFTQFYANGRRSMDGMAALLGSMLTLPQLPYIGKGMEQNRIAWLGSLAKQQGYETIMLQSSNRGSFHMDAIAANAGFDRYYGAEDIPAIAGHAEQASDWGVWDYQTFMFASQQYAKTQKPFLSFIFTSTTHNPWRVPSSKWEKFEPVDDYKRYLNTLAYADWSLGEFISEAKKAGYYDNTIFIFTGDHIGRFGDDPTNPRERYHLPLLVLAPGIKPGLDDRIGSQLDVLPSVADLAGWNIRHGSLGASLFSAEVNTDRGVFAVNGSVIEWLGAEGTISHNLEKRIESQGQNIDELEKRLLATEQVVMDMLLKNKVTQ
ncbi:MAG: LTA synthase family protein [Gammaproteobacteria bacterium]|nr:LTA synthase family protein [Gammaproteobacteria bacterium]